MPSSMTMSPNPSRPPPPPPPPPPPSPWRTASPSLHRQFVTESSVARLYSVTRLKLVVSSMTDLCTYKQGVKSMESWRGVHCGRYLHISGSLNERSSSLIILRNTVWS
ncbi:uncharacterized protein LOC110430898 isoform X2 [Sorghum bicolor]|uniref:uncharacterized protein LOC110430898 isoform X2 n=1 Tax=Sorghum bicolor TaxID=4558 RepID=UPI000B424D94|nr:uncharacterized protein LOC110430898 isoform X2 [Sorghum bicolor]|eukprot:XP_021304762.1 uncharacterized protein LOC110430898 isoform X2 [Sorghum bicolor]